MVADRTGLLFLGFRALCDARCLDTVVSLVSNARLLGSWLLLRRLLGSLLLSLSLLLEISLILLSRLLSFSFLLRLYFCLLGSLLLSLSLLFEISLILLSRLLSFGFLLRLYFCLCPDSILFHLENLLLRLLKLALLFLDIFQLILEEIELFLALSQFTVDSIDVVNFGLSKSLNVFRLLDSYRAVYSRDSLVVHQVPIVLIGLHPVLIEMILKLRRQSHVLRYNNCFLI